MKIRNLTGFICLILALAIGSGVLVSCSADKEPEPEITNDVTRPVFTKTSTITVYRVSSNTGGINFWGNASLPDGTVLVSQLYENGKLLEWWPEDREIIVTDSKWRIIVIEGDGITADDLVFPIDNGYEFFIWQKDDPDVGTGFFYDISPPPIDIPDELE